MDINDEEIPYVFKILLLGDGGVGKTSLLRRFIHNTFDVDYHSTIGVQFMTKIIKFHNKNVKLVIWDIAGQSKHTTYRHLYYKAANGVILVYDLTRENSFYNLPKWIKDAKESVGPDMKIAIFGNKEDLEHQRVIPTYAGQNYANQIGSTIFAETSAKSGYNVEVAFLDLAKALVERSDRIQKGLEDNTDVKY
jgi:small GTP-binding protein